MARVKVQLADNIKRVVFVDPDANVGATIGTDLKLPNGDVATKSSLAAYLGVSDNVGITAHRLLAGLALGDDHPQYTRKDTLTTRGDLYMRGASTVQRLGLGTNKQILSSDGTDAVWQTRDANPSVSVGLTAVNGSASTFMRSDAAPALSQAIAPTWTNLHSFTNGLDMVSGPLRWYNVTTPSTPAAGVISMYAQTNQGHTQVNLMDEDGTTLRICRDNVLIVRNTSGSSMPKGTVVNLNGSTGTVPTVGLADADSLTLHAEGLLLEAIANNGYGLMMVTGNLTGLDTAALVEGAKIYLSSTAGAYTTTAPVAPAYVQELGTVVRAHATQGVIEVSVSDRTTQGANPSASIGLTTVNGSANSYMRSDAAPALDVSISPTWSGTHTFSNTPVVPNASWTYAKLADLSALSILGRSANSSGVMAAITASTDGQTLRRSGTSIGFGALDLANANAITGDLPFANLTQGSALSVLGVTGNVTADLASIAAGTDGQVLRRSGTALSFGAIDISSSNAVTNRLAFANLTQGSARSVLAVSGASTADFASVSAGSDDTILGRTSGSLSFGQLTVGMFPANVVTYAKIQQVSATSRVLGRITTGAGNIEELTGANLATIIGTSLGANPSASVGLAAVNGSAGTYMRSDGAPALDQSISPTWSGTHIFSNQIKGADGAVTAPGFTFSADLDTGMYRPTTNQLALATAGVQRLFIDANGNIGINTASPNLTGTGTALSVIGTGTARGVIEFGCATATVLAMGQFAAYNGSTLAALTQYVSDGVNTDAGEMKIFTKATGVAISEKLRVTGIGQLLVTAGSAAAPAISWLLDTDTGFFRDTANQIAIALGGSQALQFNGVTTTGAQTATFTATNKPGSGTAGPIAWLPVLTAGGTQGYIPIFGA